MDYIESIETEGNAMQLMTKAIEDKLRKNGGINALHRMRDGNTEDFKPVVKFFNPCGAATWLITEISDEGEDENGEHDLILFGLCDLGMGSPELGTVSFNELKSIRVMGNLGIERDIHWAAVTTLSEYAKIARKEGMIIA